MIDTTTHNFNHCAGAAATAASAIVANSGSNGNDTSSRAHLNSEQDHYPAAHNHDYTATDHHHNHHHHQLTELNSISENLLLAKYCTTNLEPEAQYSSCSTRFRSNDKQTTTIITTDSKSADRVGSNQERFYYSSNSDLNDTGYNSTGCWSRAIHNSSNTSAWSDATDENRTINQRSFRDSPESREWQQHQQESRARLKRQHQPEIYQTNSPAELSPSYHHPNHPNHHHHHHQHNHHHHHHHQQQQLTNDASATTTLVPSDESGPGAYLAGDSGESSTAKDKPVSSGNEFSQLRILEMRKEKSRDAARSRRSKENHEFYELAKLLPLPAAITSQLDFLDKASIIRLTISFLKLRQFSVNGHPPWAPDFATLGSINPYSSQSATNCYGEQQQYASDTSGQQQEDSSQSRPTSVKHPVISASPSSSSSQLAHNQSYASSSNTLTSSVTRPSSVTVAFSSQEHHYQQTAVSDCLQDRGAFVSAFINSEQKLTNNNYHKNSSLFDIHQGTHILQSLDGFAFAIGRDGRFLYISETVSMYLGLSQVEMTGSSVFDYTHQQDHEELARHLGIQNPTKDSACDANVCVSTRPGSVHSQYSAASNETLIDDYVNHHHRSGGGPARKRTKTTGALPGRGAYGRNTLSKRTQISTNEQLTSDCTRTAIKIEANDNVDTQPLGANPMLSDTNGPKEGPENHNQRQGTEEDPLVRQFCIRMKSTLTKRGCQHFKSSGYRVVHVVAHLRSYQSNDHGHLMDPLDEPSVVLPASSAKPSKRRGPKSASASSSNKIATAKQQSAGKNDDATSGTFAELATGEDNRAATKQAKIIGMVAVAIALPPPSINELRLESDTFVLRLSLDLKITHIEPRITELLHYPVELIAGRSLYSLIHPADAHQVQRCHRDLLTKGQMMSGYYRLLARDGGYIWIQTCATLICNNTNTNLGGQVAQILPQSPSSSTGIHNNPLNAEQQPGKSSASYLAAPSPLNPANQYPNSKLLASPGLSSSQLSSNFDSVDQDQCVIFVNYMITNVIESGEMMDVCQSQEFSALSNSISGISNNNNNNNSNILYSSPSSLCSPPCMSSLKSLNNNAASYVQSTTPTSATLIANQRRHQTDHRAKEVTKSTNGRRAAASGKTTSKITSYLTADENDQSSAYLDHQRQTKLDQHHQTIEHQHEANEMNPSESNAVYASYESISGGVNLALSNNNSNKVQQGLVAAESNHHHWLSAAVQQQTNNYHHHHHHNHDHGQQGNHHRASDGQAATAAIVYGTSQGSDHHYSGIDRSSIYKAAFGLGGGSTYGGQHHHHHNHHQQQQQQQQQQQSIAGAASSQLYPSPTGQVVAAAAYGSATVAAAAASAPAVCNTSGWDNAAAVAAVAAASNLTSHHHHGMATGNPYAHLEPHHHHHHHQHAAAAAAAAAHSLSQPGANHHHSGAGNYYNYYGYYGNKFI